MFSFLFIRVRGDFVIRVKSVLFFFIRVGGFGLFFG